MSETKRSPLRRGGGGAGGRRSGSVSAPADGGGVLADEGVPVTVGPPVWGPSTCSS